jgi:hypothetical protein
MQMATACTIPGSILSIIAMYRRATDIKACHHTGVRTTTRCGTFPHSLCSKKLVEDVFRKIPLEAKDGSSVFAN